jgi:hypothetical protein
MDYKTIKNWQFSRFTIKPAWLGFENQLGFRKKLITVAKQISFGFIGLPTDFRQFQNLVLFRFCNPWLVVLGLTTTSLACNKHYRNPTNFRQPEAHINRLVLTEVS